MKAKIPLDFNSQAISNVIYTDHRNLSLSHLAIILTIIIVIMQNCSSDSPSFSSLTSYFRNSFLTTFCQETIIFAHAPHSFHRNILLFVLLPYKSQKERKSIAIFQKIFEKIKKPEGTSLPAFLSLYPIFCILPSVFHKYCIPSAVIKTLSAVQYDTFVTASRSSEEEISSMVLKSTMVNFPSVWV